MSNKTNNAYKTIGEVCKILNLNSDKNQKKSHNYTIRFWETKFKQIKPKFINNRRYYDNKNVKILKKIQFLLKNQGMTIAGAKKFLNDENLNIDARNNDLIKTTNIKYRINKVSRILKELKKN
tara:strand:+ start:9130 stop:9498 length:369 start_codon:yes stop_codon:yes gene_type:complete